MLRLIAIGKQSVLILIMCLMSLIFSNFIDNHMIKNCLVRTEILNLLEAGIIYHIADSRWVSPVHGVPKKGGITVVSNDKNELISQRIVTGYRMVIDFRKLNKATRKDHYPLPFIDQMLERLSKHTHFCFLDGYSGFSQIPVSKEDQEK